ncbi:MAG: aldehyde dehydrogenase family protein, partial [Alphaproteobacteria bacterium]|nr:aldehyde dehydrogenase family protein [Alphaproteobacteria bacterium]
KTDDDGRPFDSHSPIDRDILLGRFVAASPAAVARAVAAAQAAQPAWGRTPWRERVALFRRLAEALARRKYDIGMALLIEVGKSRIESLGEAEESVDMVLYYCGEMERNNGFVRPLSRAFPNEETTDVLRPFSVFGVISPFNFPIALAVGMMTGAVLTGNTAVLKPSPMSGLSASLLMDALEDAGFPAGVVNMVCGGDDVGRALTGDSRLGGVAFTGSHQVGMEIFRAFAQGSQARPVLAEMGGKNPAYVARAADLDAAAAGIMRSAFGLQGQKCSACSKVYVAREVMDSFLDRLKALTAKIRIGDPQARDVYMGPVIDSRAGARFDKAVAAARAEGRILAGGERLTGGLFDRGVYLAPTIVAGLNADHWIHRDELFLPFLAVQPFDDLGAAIADGNRVAYGLTAGVYSDRREDLELFQDRAEAGALYVNRAAGATTGAWPGIQSFCGWKGTGLTGKGGLGPYYLQQFMREQSRTVVLKT